MLPILAPNYKIVEITPKAMRGESIPRHEDVLPKAEDIPKLLQALKRGIARRGGRQRDGTARKAHER